MCIGSRLKKCGRAREGNKKPGAVAGLKVIYLLVALGVLDESFRIYFQSHHNHR